MVPITLLTFLTCLLSFSNTGLLARPQTHWACTHLRALARGVLCSPRYVCPLLLQGFIQMLFPQSVLPWPLDWKLVLLNPLPLLLYFLPSTCHHWTCCLFSFFSLFIFLLILLHSHKKVNSTGAWICVCGSLPLCLQGMAQSLVRIRLLLTLGINEGSKMTGLFTTIINSELLLHSLHTRMCLVLNSLSLEKSIWWNWIKIKSKRSIKKMHYEIPIKTMIWPMTELKQTWVIFPSCLLTSLNYKSASTYLSAVLCFFGVCNGLLSSLYFWGSFLTVLIASVDFLQYSTFGHLNSHFYSVSRWSHPLIPAQTALLLNDFLNLYIPLQPLPDVPILCVHFLYKTALPLSSPGFGKDTTIC